MSNASGVLVGADKKGEWLLPWFYSHFQTHNSNLAMAFADFGMSLEALAWCQKKGKVFTVPEILTLDTKQTGFFFQGELWKEWKLDLTTVAPERWVCFRKPVALVNSPFEKTLWLDLDCQVRGDLSPLFSLSLPSSKLGVTPCGSFTHVHNLSKEHVILMDKYNTGVILVEKNSPLLHQWLSLSSGQAFFRTDEGSLSFLIDRNQREITEIPHRYNWPASNWGENEEALIYHWLGKEGKLFLKTCI